MTTTFAKKNEPPSKAELDAELELFASERKRKAGLSTKTGGPNSITNQNNSTNNQDQASIVKKQELTKSQSKASTLPNITTTSFSTSVIKTRSLGPSNVLDADLDDYWKNYKKPEKEKEETGPTEAATAGGKEEEEEEEEDSVLIGAQ